MKITYLSLSLLVFSLTAHGAGAEYKIAASPSWPGASVESAIKAAKPIPALSVPVRPMVMGSALMPGFASQLLETPTIGHIGKK